jgi:MFS transporter, DHA1 family, inner membrane transport protein
MSGSPQHHELPKSRELMTLVALAAVQFTHILDFMIIMPLGAQLMRVFQITPAQFSHLVASYGMAAAVSGLAGGFVLDRFDRKRSLLILYTCFGIATFACGFAPTHHALLAARIAAGAFGGLSGAMVTAMIGDIIPPARRGRAMSIVMAAFPIASVLGVPAGLILAGTYGWHAPFFLLGACAVLNLVIASFAIPHLSTAVHHNNPLQQMREIVTHGIHLRAFALSMVLVMAGGCIIPFLAPSLVANLGISEADLPKAYAVGGLATLFSTPLVGALSDRFDRLHLLTIISVGAAAVVLVLTNLGPSSLVVACAIMSFFMVTMSGRFAPAMAMVTNAVDARYRGGFMSVNSALQQAASGLGSVLAGVFVTTGPGGRLLGYPILGLVSVGFFGLTVFFAARLKSAAPHVSRSERSEPTPPVEIAA